MKTKILLLVSLLLFAWSARAQNTPDLQKMEYTVRTMQQTIIDLQRQIAELKQNQATNVTYVTNATNSLGFAVQPAQTGKPVEFTVPTIQTETGESQIVLHEDM